MNLKEEPIAVSAEHNLGIELLKELICSKIIKSKKIIKNKKIITDFSTVAVVGKPNVGKSTLINALLGDERMITSNIAGTTVDSVDSVINLFGTEYLFIDTAGLRRKSKTKAGLELLSVVQVKKTLERADLALILIDGGEGISDQDEKIGGLIEEMGSSVIIVINKWDLQSNNKNFSRKDAEDHIRRKIKFLKYAPIVFMSAINKKGIMQLSKVMKKVLIERDTKIQTHSLTECVKEAVKIQNPKNAKFYYTHQVSRHPPSFACHVNDPRRVPNSLRRQIMNQMRNLWGFSGTPIRLIIKKH